MTETDETGAFLRDHADIAHVDAVLFDLCGNAYGKRLPRAASSIACPARRPIPIW